MLGTDPGVKAPGVPRPFGSSHGQYYLEVSPGSIVPGSGLAPWIAKPLGGSPSVQGAWVI
jgi:hypothetical protein